MGFYSCKFGLFQKSHNCKAQQFSAVWCQDFPVNLGLIGNYFEEIENLLKKFYKNVSGGTIIVNITT
jgi:hypothetical protein